jgi:hypothetical protein
MAILNELKARLGLDTAAFSRGLKGVQNETRSMGQKMRAALLPAATAMTDMSVGLAYAIKGQLDSADEMAKSAQKFGVPVEELSRLKYAADLSDVSLDTLGAGLRGLSKNMSAALSGNKGAVALFKDLGVEVTDATGKLRPTEAVMQDLSDVIAKMPDGAEKTALAMKVFGKSGAEMVPMLNSGAAALRAMADEANAMGIVIDEKTGNAAQNFNDNITRIKTAVGGLIVQLAAALAPALERISAWVVGLTQTFQNLSPRMKEIAGVVAMVVAALGPAGLAIAAMSPAIGLVTTALGALKIALLGNPITLVIAGIAAGAYLIYQNWEGISAWFSELWTTVKGAFSGNWEDIKALMLGYTPAGIIYSNWGSISQWFGALFQGVKSAFSVGWEGIKTLMLGYAPAGIIYSNWGGVSAWFGTQLQDVKSEFSAGWQSIKDVTAQWANDFLTIGGQIVDGLKVGIKAEWDKMVAWFKGLADDLVSDFKGWLSIASPSRVFREIGEFITQGLGLGLKDGEGGVKAAMQGVADAVGAVGLTDGLYSFRDAARGVFSQVALQGKNLGDVLRTTLGSWLGNAANSLFNSGFDALWGAIGLPAFANGTTNFAGGLALVGERGPEIVNLPRGADVYTNSESRRMASGMGGGGVTEIHVYADPSVIVSTAHGEAVRVINQARPGIVRDSVQATYGAAKEVPIR